MSKVFIEETTLTAIGDAIRAKEGTTELVPVSDMATRITAISGGGEGGYEPPEEAFNLTGNCTYRFAYGGWDWFIEDFGSRITTSGITNSSYMFEKSQITNIPFDINYSGSSDCTNMFDACYFLTSIPAIDFKQTSYKDLKYMFNSCESLTSIGELSNLYPSAMNNMFSYCHRLRELPKFTNLNLTRVNAYNYAGASQMFRGCYSLRSIPEDFLQQFNQATTNASNHFLYYLCNSNYVLDEIRGLKTGTGTITSNMFSNTFNGCYRLKDIIFYTNDDGTVQQARWSNQTIDLTNCGAGTVTAMTIYNSGITEDKEVKDDATYQALKNDPDWFATSEAYSRYNHDSAVNTINSLPDTTIYATNNVIKFRGEAGSLTDGGAINTLTEEEIAVATAKGWTVTLV